MAKARLETDQLMCTTVPRNPDAYADKNQIILIINLEPLTHIIYQTLE